MNCAGTVAGVNGGTDQRVACSIANCSAVNSIDAETARRAGLELADLERRVTLTDAFGQSTSAGALARNVRISLRDADGQWVEFLLPTLLVQRQMNPHCRVTLGQPFFKTFGEIYGGLSLSSEGLGGGPLGGSNGQWFPEDPDVQESPDDAFVGYSQWQPGTTPKTCTVCGLEFPGLKTCGACRAEATPRAQQPLYCSRECQRRHWQSEHRAFHRKRNDAIDGALGRGGLPADAQGVVRGF